MLCFYFFGLREQRKLSEYYFLNAKNNKSKANIFFDTREYNKLKYVFYKYQFSIILSILCFKLIFSISLVE